MGFRFGLRLLSFQLNPAVYCSKSRVSNEVSGIGGQLRQR